MEAMSVGVDLFVLNYNGGTLLPRCLPSVCRAADKSSFRCRVWLVDNSSSDGSADWAATRFPQLRLVRMPNNGLCSLNKAAEIAEGDLCLLLNNDVVLAEDTIDPLLQPFLEGGSEWLFATVPRCHRVADGSYEGLLAAVQWRWGLVQATAFFPGCQKLSYQRLKTVCGGCALAVRRKTFLELGGFDALYLPGRIEDLDLVFRAFLAGYYTLYVPDAVVWHIGMASFAREFGTQGCMQLAWRNTLLFQWKNLRAPEHKLRTVVGVFLRLLREYARPLAQSSGSRQTFAEAFSQAVCRWRSWNNKARLSSSSIKRERMFFRDLSPKAFAQLAASDASFDSFHRKVECPAGV